MSYLLRPSCVLASLALALAAACTRAAPPAASPVEISIPPLGDAGSSASTAAEVTRLTECRARLRAERIRTGASCILDEQVSQGPGLLLYPCSGDGPASATFGEHRFEGVMSAGRAALELTTELDWDDGCHWETKQALLGDITSLTWSYSERAVSGTKCFGACTATATVRARVESGDATGAGEDEDDDDDEDDDGS
jgi:hypothetical protein